MRAASETSEGGYPVETWNPQYCGTMDMVIRRDGSWWHEGTRITRQPLIDLFAKVLRRDEDGKYYLVTPVEKIEIQVACAPFLAVRMDIENEGPQQRVFFTTNVDDVFEVGPKHPISVDTNARTLEPTPLTRVRGRLDALITRPVFYELVEHAQIVDDQIGLYAGGEFFPLGPKGIQNVD